MLFSRWFHRGRRPTRGAKPAVRASRPPRAFQPTVRSLEGRIVPSGFGHPVLQPPPGPATHLQVIVPENVQANKPFDVLVEAVDASNRPATGYTGTVSFSVSPTDAGATASATYGGNSTLLSSFSYPFSSQDHGFHEFQVTLTVAGTPTITATGTTSSTPITGTAATTVNPAPVATQLLVIAPEQTTVGTPTNITVVAEDAAGHVVRNYADTVSLTTPNGTASLVSSSNGVYHFTVTFTSAATGADAHRDRYDHGQLDQGARHGFGQRIRRGAGHALRRSRPVPCGDRHHAGYRRGLERFQPGSNRLHRHGQPRGYHRYHRRHSGQLRQWSLCVLAEPHHDWVKDACRLGPLDSPHHGHRLSDGQLARAVAEFLRLVVVSEAREPSKNCRAGVITLALFFAMAYALTR